MQETFDKYINYLEAERNASRYTVRNYTSDLMEFFYFLRSKKVPSWEEVSKSVLRSYLSRLNEQGIVKASIARKLSAIRSFYRYMLREKIIATNPIATASPKLDKRLPSFLTVGEVERLLGAPDLSTPQGRRDRALIELLYASGLRVSELVSLNLEQVNLNTNEIRVRGKGAKERVVLIGKPAAQALSEYLSQGRAELLSGKKGGNALFLNRNGERLVARRVQRILEKYANITGIGKRVYPHMLRHTFATHLLDGGADLRVVQELLGHANLSSTQIYTHVSKSQARKVYLAAHPLAAKNNELEK